MRFQLLEDVQVASQIIKMDSSKEDFKSFLNSKQQIRSGYKQCHYNHKQMNYSVNTTYKLP